MEYSTNFIGKIRSGEIKAVRLAEDSFIKPFDCGVKDLNDFLFEDAKVYLKYLKSTTYLFENNDKTICKYTRSA